MDWQTLCVAVIPCLNEAEAIGDVVRAVQAHLPHVVVVDDGSSDTTEAEARQAGAHVVRHESPQGKGAALRDGWKRARELGFRWALCLDGDGQHAASDIPALLERAQQTGAAMVVGDRMSNPAGMPWLRRQVNRWMSRRLSKLAGQRLSDTQNGFRLMKLEALPSLPEGAAHFEIESDVLLAYLLAGEVVEFVPIEVIYRSERSKIHPVRDTLRWFRWWREAERRFAARRGNP